jgi:hypothetical protein
MKAVEVQHYLSRARDFLKGMTLLKDDLAEFNYSSALLGIHGAISYCDALRIGLGGKSVSSENHKSAARELRVLLTSRKYNDKQGIERLQNLLSYKGLIAYSIERVSEKDIKSIIQQAERFALWAERTGTQLNVEGWG